MKILFLLGIFIAANAGGQTLSKTIVLSNGSDTAYWLDWQLPNIEKLKLINPNSDTDFFRLTSICSMCSMSDDSWLELTKDSGRVVFGVDEEWNGKPTGDSVIQYYSLTENQISGIKRLIDSLEINKIPSDKYIADWKLGFDGDVCIIENKNGNNYSFKTYWTPSAQGNLKEAKTILNFTTQTDSIINYPQLREKFLFMRGRISATVHGQLLKQLQAAVITENTNGKKKKS